MMFSGRHAGAGRYDDRIKNCHFQFCGIQKTGTQNEEYTYDTAFIRPNIPLLFYLIPQVNCFVQASAAQQLADLCAMEKILLLLK